MATGTATVLSNITAKARTDLTNQGWKDSQDSIFHADGHLAPGAIALCEVQAYVYAAKHGGAMLARMLGEHAKADLLADAAGAAAPAL